MLEIRHALCLKEQLQKDIDKKVEDLCEVQKNLLKVCKHSDSIQILAGEDSYFTFSPEIRLCALCGHEELGPETENSVIKGPHRKLSRNGLLALSNELNRYLFEGEYSET